MVFEFNASTREVLEQWVREPRFQALTKLPVFAIQEIALIAGAFGLFALSTWAWMQGFIPALAMILINGFASYCSFTPLHDATHRTVSSSRLVNDVLGTISCLLLLPGITTRIYRYLHLEHHRYAGDPARDPDEDFVSGNPIQLFVVLVFPDVHWAVWYLKCWNTRPRAERAEYLASFTFYIVFYVYWLSSPWAWEFLLAFAIPHRLGLLLVTWFFAHIQHPEGMMWEQVPFQTTVRVRCAAVFRWLLLGQSKHCIHHLAPSLPYYRYHRAWNLGQHLLSRQRIPERGLFGSTGKIELPKRIRSTTWLQALVKDVTLVADDVRRYELIPADNAQWPAFEAGAHIDVCVDEDTTRQYSLCNDPGDSDRYVIAVKREENGRGGSRKLHDWVMPGDRLQISAPRNHFPLRTDFDRYFLVAGGIGLTPLLAMARVLHGLGKAFELHVCARHAGALALRDELSDSAFADSIHLHFDDAGAGNGFDAKAVLGRYDHNQALYTCGPSGFMNMLISSARELGWPAGQIFSESFVAARADERKNKPFRVKIASTGAMLDVPEDAFLIDVLHNNGYPVMCSCTQGICGSCITPVLDGRPEHRDAVLSDSERAANDRMCVCVSRAQGETLTLDL